MRALVAVSLLLSAVAFADEAGGLTWKVPGEWKRLPDRPMRAATYALPAAGASEAGELAVFYFGPGQGGGVDANVQRWIGQFEQPDGKPSDKVAKISKKKVGANQVTFVDLTGIYTASMGPMAPKSNKPGYRLLGAIVEGPEGAVFFKVTGPQKAVDAAQKDFDNVIKSVKAKK